MVEIKHFTQRKGQTLIEFVVCAGGFFGIWTVVFFFSKSVLNKVIAESWSVVGARKALSMIPIEAPKKISVLQQRNFVSAQSRVWVQDQKSGYTIVIPKESKNSASKEMLPSLFSYFGSRFSSFLE